MSGGRIGTKRSDRRWRAPTGEEFDSRFEWEVYAGLGGNGYRVRRCEDSDSIAYHTKVKQGRCVECSSPNVLQERIYTPDLHVAGHKGKGSVASGGYYIECKGYFPADKRGLFRAVANQIQDIDLRIVFPSVVRLRGTSGTNVEYVQKYCKSIPVGVWNKKTGEIQWIQ